MAKTRLLPKGKTVINYDKHIYELETLGFTIVEKVFSAEMVQQLKSELDTALADDMKMFGDRPGKDPDLVVDLSIHNPVFIKALDNDIMMELWTRMLGPCVLYSYTSTILRPSIKSGVHNMHIDTYKFVPNHVTGIVVTIALDDFDANNGATVYLPGSQNSSIKPLEETFAKYCLPTNRKAGDALFFNPRVWHRAGDNSTDKIRYGITAYATRAYIKQRFDFPRMIPAESVRGISERLKSFLGFNNVVPVSMHDYYKPVEERVHKSH